MIRKHIRLYEDFETPELKELTSETSGTWSNIRNTIQNLEPFTIINFMDEDGYSKFIDNTSHDYIKQERYNFNDEEQRVSPSIFIKGTVNINDNDYDEYNIYNILVGKNDSDKVMVKTEDKDDEIVGNEIVDSLSKEDIEGEEHYKIGSVYYKFINFLS